MTDNHDNDRDSPRQHLPSPSPSPVGYPVGLSASGHRDVHRDGPATPSERRSTSGYETGESSTTGGQQHSPELYHDKLLDLPEHGDNHGMPIGFDPSSEQLPQQEQHAWLRQPHHDDDAPREERVHRKHRNKISGGFLLRNPLSGGRSYGFRRQRESRSLSQTQANGGHDVGPRTSSGSGRGKRQSLPASHFIGDEPPLSTSNREPRRVSDSHSRQDRPPMDADSSQIVLMALNLSESRRMAGRLSMSRATPPRLAPVPDASSPSALQQHLQQQRKTSRGAGPPPIQETSSRIPSVSAPNSSFETAFDPGHDVQYAYNFSPSTLARAQKAKDHLELLAQYRRLLEVLPPLKPGFDKPISGVHTISPTTNTSSVTLGRQYNPLQYVRNRKVRARERQTIDGDRQGFGDVDCVRTWVDAVSGQMSLAGTSLHQGKNSIPVFPSAEEIYSQESSDLPTRVTSRSRRPRADWFMEPCDMIADAYWLEKDWHKTLIEDRHWRKIFPAPPAAELHRPMSREVDDLSLNTSPSSLNAFEQFDNAADEGEQGPIKDRIDLSHSSAKERAKQKLLHIREGFHHKQGGSMHLKRGSISDFSDSEADAGSEGKKNRPGRKGTISSNSNDLLQKQMLEMLAKEAKEKELGDLEEIPEHRPFSQPPSRTNSRKGSLADHSDSDPRSASARSQVGSPGRHGLYKNNLSMSSVGNDSSQANSPELQPTGSNTIEQIVNLDSPPSSRSGSPVRKPLEKIKRIIRDKSGESLEPRLIDAEDDGESRLSRQPSSSLRPAILSRRQTSPAGKSTHLQILEGSKHQRMNSKRVRADDGVGLRSMFKGPRIDTMIRDSVYKWGDKIGDKIWRKDASNGAPELEDTDDSDNDRGKVRRGGKASPSLSRKTSYKAKSLVKKHLLDSMPLFQHAPDPRHPAAPDVISQGGQPSRFDLMNVPRIETHNEASYVSLPPELGKPCLDDSEASEPESSPGSTLEVSGEPPTSATAMIKIEHARRRLSRTWSAAQFDVPSPTGLSRREIARMKTLILCSGIKAMEIHRRALEQQKPFSRESLAVSTAICKQMPGGIPWSEIMELGPSQPELSEREVPLQQVYPLAAQALNVAIQSWGHRWQHSARRFTGKTGLELEKRAWDVRTRLADDLSEMTRKAADEADETSRDLALGQPLKIKHVVDTMEKMLRKRHRRFRWIRRGMWLTVEWLLVGFMWYVWFMVMILRVFLGVGKGVFRCVRWLLWL